MEEGGKGSGGQGTRGEGAGPLIALYLVAGILALSFAYDLMRMPIQLTDSLGGILDAHGSVSTYDAVVGSARRAAYLRPFRILQIEILYDITSGKYYWLVFRGFHALLLIACVLLFARALRVRDWRDCAAAIFALTVLTGLHTFRGTVRESFPINAFLESAVFCLVALNLARSRGGWWVDVAAVLTLVAASLTLESGLLVWVVLVAAWIAGMRGVSARGITAVTGTLVLYFVARFFLLSTGMPGLEERASGFGFGVLEPAELQARFGANPLPFYAYNVVASVMSIVLSEPQSGTFGFTSGLVQGTLLPRLWLPVLSSILTTGLMVWAGVNLFRRRDMAASLPGAPLLVIFPVVLLANAVLSYAYTKDEIVSTAGVFYALAAFPAARFALERLAPHRVAVILCVLLAVTASMWAFRTVGVHHVLRTQAFKHRGDWARIEPARWRDEGTPDERGEAAIVRQLRRDALSMRVPNPYRMPAWANRWWGDQ